MFHCTSSLGSASWWPPPSSSDWKLTGNWPSKYPISPEQWKIHFSNQYLDGGQTDEEEEEEDRRRDISQSGWDVSLLQFSGMKLVAITSHSSHLPVIDTTTTITGTASGPRDEAPLGTLNQLPLKVLPRNPIQRKISNGNPG